MKMMMKKVLMTATMRTQMTTHKKTKMSATKIQKRMNLKPNTKSSGKLLARILNLESLKIKQTEKNSPSY
mgnify:CR=1 FL=1